MFKWLLIALFSCSFSVVAAEQAQPVSKVTPQEINVETHTSNGNLILGEKEWIYIQPLNRNLLMRVDTGATTSSISAIDITTFKKADKEYVTFTLAHDGWKSEPMTLPIKSKTEIRQSTSDKLIPRVIVDLPVQIGDLETKTEFTLADRTHLQYPVLLGRTFIDNTALVDVSHKYVQPRVKLDKTANEDDDKPTKTEK